MFIFLEKNWKFLLFSFSCCFIICIDRILHYPLNQRIRPICRPSDLIGLPKDGSDLSGSWLGGINREK